MSEEPPGGWELKRGIESLNKGMRDGFADMNKRFDDITKSTVSTGVHTETTRRIDQRLDEMAKDIADERAARAADIAAERTARSADDVTERAARKESIETLNAAMAKTGMWVRWLAAAIVVPIALALMTIFLARQP